MKSLLLGMLALIIAGQYESDWLTVSGTGPLSEETEACLACHEYVTPGIVADWKKSRHANVTLGQALNKDKLEKRVSIDSAPRDMMNLAVGCAECHTLNPETHKDTFDHGEYQVHVVVSPKDCAACHPAEEREYGKNIMSHAYNNLLGNPVYHNLVDTTAGIQSFDEVGTVLQKPGEETLADACLFCHGAKVEVKGFREWETVMGEMEFPVLTGWPNQGVGRINPDGSKGACTPCHPRHQFSIEVARKPYTCAKCHKGPDVPAYKVYKSSKHGNIYDSLASGWDFTNVPWTVGKDFNAPTCAVCHISLIVTEQDEVVTQRTHRMNDRLPWRIFGLIYAHPHPKSPDTTIIKNKAGLQLPTELTGEPVAEYLIGEIEMENRRNNMKKVCLTCHSTDWVDGHFDRLENTIATTNAMTLAATKILLTAWEKGAAKGLDQGDSIFNETIEKMWVEQWLFFANSTRFASAMMGADYGVFANGRWQMAKNLQQMIDWLNFKINGKKKLRRR